MWFTCLLAPWRSTRQARQIRKTVRRRRPSIRLAIEILENRLVPSGLHGAEHASADPNDWPMFGHDAAGTRFNSAEHELGPQNAGDLEVKWTYPTDGPIIGTPAVVKDHIFAADAKGNV